MVTWLIESEDSSDALRYVQCRGKNVLDLGCGRWMDRFGNWENLNQQEFTPVFFANRGANKVVGVDSRPEEAVFFNDYFKSEREGKFVFIHDTIERAQQLTDLIKTYDIDYVKSDIETYETCFLTLAAEDLKQIDTFVLEYHRDDIKDAFMSKFKEWGFTVFANGEVAWVPGIGVLFASREPGLTVETPQDAKIEFARRRNNPSWSEFWRCVVKQDDVIDSLLEFYAQNRSSGVKTRINPDNTETISYCLNCGTVVGNQKFCHGCGHKLRH